MEKVRSISINGFEAWDQNEFGYAHGKVYVKWNGMPPYIPREEEVLGPIKDVDSDKGYYIQPGITLSVIPDTAECVDIYLVPDDNYAPKLKLSDGQNNSSYVDNIKYDENKDLYIYRYYFSDEKLGITDEQPFGMVTFTPEFVYDTSAGKAELEFGNIQSYGDGVLYTADGCGSFEVFYDEKNLFLILIKNSPMFTKMGTDCMIYAKQSF